MRNIKITIEYDGTNYSGWQIQNRHQVIPRRRSLRDSGSGLPSVARSSGHQKITIQQVIEKTLQKILQEKIKIIGSGRTDAGVHALCQVASFKTQSKIPLEKLHKALNALLPKDIAVSSIEEASPDFHARFKARSKLYRYTILNSKYSSVFLRHQAYFYPYPLDINLMRKEARCLLGRHNFRSFQAVDKKQRSSIRTINQIKIKKNKSLIIIDIEANGFLYNMARNIVGTLLEIGRGRFPQRSMKKILFEKNRAKAGPTAPARGLCLLKVYY